MILVDRAWRVRSNKSKNAGIGQGNPELRRASNYIGRNEGLASTFRKSAFANLELREIRAKLNFLLWECNWICVAIVHTTDTHQKECSGGSDADPWAFANDLHDDAVVGKPILWGTTHQHIGETFEGSVNYLSPFFINFYRGMGLLTVAEQK
ncbi:hypothetical protein AXG93_1976s1020 [Marchantia polymorpha subsp. ruderalis]|uniref:Uncharacterized protein n=1 Tax=Marchantia polymorpha subsp. ruderalis TaxID=1480154 RepID=A0A176VD93_MARPO|nr:hypothetical protein AXG93_1976s1020 [Marchantia polymorpha subsp. ruderalis]